VAAVVIAGVAAIVVILGFRGSLFPLLPRSLTTWWVERAIPLGSSYEDVRVMVRSRGWRESSGTWSCPSGSSAHGAFMSVELGHILVGMPLVKYAFAHFTFDATCRLISIDVVTEIDGP
jgi:hypothetical protein